MTEDVVTCGNCGQRLRPGNRFCTHCGAQVKPKLAPSAKTPVSPVLTGTGITSDEARRRQHQRDDERRKRQRETEEQERRRREEGQRRRRAEEDRRRREEQARRRK